MKDAIELITQERLRQVNEEGWTSEHDDKWEDNELAGAAACYAANAAGSRILQRCWIEGIEDRGAAKRCVSLWPFDRKWDKRATHDKKKCLVISGAFIIAELERIQRKEKKC